MRQRRPVDNNSCPPKLRRESTTADHLNGTSMSETCRCFSDMALTSASATRNRIVIRGARWFATNGDTKVTDAGTITYSKRYPTEARQDTFPIPSKLLRLRRARACLTQASAPYISITCDMTIKAFLFMSLPLDHFRQLETRMEPGFHLTHESVYRHAHRQRTSALARWLLPPSEAVINAIRAEDCRIG